MTAAWTRDPDMQALVADFERWASAGSQASPYPTLAAARAQGSVLATNIWEGTPFELPAPFAASIVRYDAALAALRDEDTFSLELYHAGNQVMGRTLLEMDGREHRAHRAVIQQAFTRNIVERRARELVAPALDECIDALAPRGRGDLVAELTLPFPITVIAGIIGLPAEDIPRFRRWAVSLVSLGFDMQRSLRAAGELREYLGALIDERRREPRDDLLSILTRARSAGRRLTDDEIFSVLLLLLPAGADTSFRSTSNLLYGLLHDPEQLERLRADRSLVPNAIEEGLRWETSVVSMTRITTRNTELDGVPIAAGSVVEINVGSGNRDEQYWDDPERFDITRTPRPLLSFGSGAHVCLGAHLVRAETALLLNRVLDRLPGLRLDPDQAAPPITGFAFRAPSRLPVVWDA